MRSWQFVVLAMTVFVGSIQADDPPGTPNREAMKKLSFLAGKWAGEATIQTGPGAPIKVKQTEDVQFRLGGVVLLIEGTGTKDKEGVVFNALATVNYDRDAKKFRMRAYRMEGQFVDPEITLTDDGFIWEFSMNSGKLQIRYTAKVKGDAWHEIGETSFDGKTWNKFLEMNLKRVKE